MPRFTVERHPERKGYTIRDAKPRRKNGDDIEGVGWVTYNPPLMLPATFGWFKHKYAALKRAEVLNKANDTTPELVM